MLLSIACNPVTPVMQYIAKVEEQGDKREGITYYVGGAGPMGNVGSWDVPQGLADSGYRGYIQVFPWQGIAHAWDQVNISRNRSKGAELSYEIRRYRRIYQNQKINIIALSAGTGIVTFALEFLPESMKVDNVVFLGCSMSSEYDMTRSLKRITGGLYVIHSRDDEVLKNIVGFTGTVDRHSAEEGVAGLEGFHLPPARRGETARQYRKLHNVGYRYDFEVTGYRGGHTDGTSRLFIAEYIAPIFFGNPQSLLGLPPSKKQETARAAPQVGASRSGH